jgi:hypothetical protein
MARVELGIGNLADKILVGVTLQMALLSSFLCAGPDTVERPSRLAFPRLDLGPSVKTQPTTSDMTFRLHTKIVYTGFA